MPKTYRQIYVRVTAPHMSLIRDDIIGVSEEEGPVKIRIHGFDEFGDPVMPAFQVPLVKEITHALHEEQIMGFNEDGEPVEEYPGRIIEIEGDVIDTIPVYYGHPDSNMCVEAIANRVINIRKEQLKGDVIMGYTRLPYPLSEELFEDRKDLADNIHKNSEAYQRCLKLIEAGEIVPVPEKAPPVKKVKAFI